MKAAICKLLLVVNLFPFVALAQTNVDTQIKRVEQGLLPPVLIKGMSSSIRSRRMYTTVWARLTWPREGARDHEL